MHLGESLFLNERVAGLSYDSPLVGHDLAYVHVLRDVTGGHGSNIVVHIGS